MSQNMYEEHLSMEDEGGTFQQIQDMLATIQLQQQSLYRFAPPEEEKQEDQSPPSETQEVPKEVQDLFFAHLQSHVNELLEDVQNNLDEVLIEREEAISIIRDVVLKTYLQSLYSHTRIGLCVYGSMASGLAIDSSDVDLAVTGHSFNGDKDK